MRETATDIEQLFAACGLAGYWPAFREKLQPCIRLTYKAVANAEATLGASRLGGLPDLPAAVAWPEFEGQPLSFLVQLNLAELPDSEIRGLLPRRGQLAFFHSLAHDDYASGAHAVVFSQEAATLPLERKTKPPGWSASETVYQAGLVSFANEQSLPGGETGYVSDVFAADEEATQPNARMRYWQLAEPDNAVETTNQLFGYPARDDDNLVLICENLYAGRDPATWRAFGEQLSAQAKAALAHKWLLLLQLDSNTDLGMSFGDLDYFYFWITREDLARQDFTRCVAFSYH